MTSAVRVAGLCLFLFTSLLGNAVTSVTNEQVAEDRFPDGFLFGAASSAYQIEGGYDLDGKGENIWDSYTKTHPHKFHNSSNGNDACDAIKHYKEDVMLLNDLGVNFYRFSISWSRILPNGHSNTINKAGLMYYNKLINELLDKGIQPVVTMYHFDLPMPLQVIGGWTNPYMAQYFEDYARILYSYFGDRVKYWITFNVGCTGYGDDVFPPFLNQPGIADYLCNHVMVLAHAKAYHLYDEEFRAGQQGKVGIVTDGRWYESESTSKQDIEAAERAREFFIGLTFNPIFHADGDYPKVVRERVDNVSRGEGYLQSRLPNFSSDEKIYVQGTYDFMGVNIYTTFLVRDLDQDWPEKTSFEKDLKAELYHDEKWGKSGSDWLRVYPEGLRKVLKWMKEKYDDPEIFITENGVSDKGEINDLSRIKYYQGYLNELLKSIHVDKVNVKGYAAWSLLDNFEWNMGYSEKFGLYHVDFEDPEKKRTPKKSANWYKKVIKERRVVSLEEISTSRLKGDL